ncbi:uncharacterized protein LOC142351894 [Convolutriloba macropyga]|uniref:uncharacterized protein LOC142351894 n=1 Tax=Convolutriloba macropyga TaxID=536237 RepID=UPI003F528635
MLLLACVWALSLSPIVLMADHDSCYDDSECHIYSNNHYGWYYWDSYIKEYRYCCMDHHCHSNCDWPNFWFFFWRIGFPVISIGLCAMGALGCVLVFRQKRRNRQRAEGMQVPPAVNYSVATAITPMPPAYNPAMQVQYPGQIAIYPPTVTQVNPGYVQDYGVAR